MKNFDTLKAFIAILISMHLQSNAFETVGQLCTAERQKELNDAFGEVSFESKVDEMKRLVILRGAYKNDPKILKKIELLNCATDLLSRPPEVSPMELTINDDVEVVIHAPDINIKNTRYELLKLAIMYRFKELIEFIYKHVPSGKIHVAYSQDGDIDDESLMSDVEILLEQTSYIDIEDMLEFLFQFKTLKELQDLYPELCEVRRHNTKLLTGCVMIDQEIEKREELARMQFFNALEEMSTEVDKNADTEGDSDLESVAAEGQDVFEEDMEIVAPKSNEPTDAKPNGDLGKAILDTLNA